VDPRLRTLNDDPVADGRYVLYWMQQSQRVPFNHALEHAVRTANDLDLPAVVGFGLVDDYPEANERHYAFLLEGLRDVRRDLADRGLKFVVRRGSPDDVTLDLARDAALVVCDRGYLRHQRKWRRRVAREAGRKVVEVESDVVVPVDAASDKAEHAARTLRPKIQRQRDEHTGHLTATEPAKQSLRLDVAGDLDVEDVDGTLAKLSVDRSCRMPPSAMTGTSAGSAAERARPGAASRRSYGDRSRGTGTAGPTRPRTPSPA